MTSYLLRTIALGAAVLLAGCELGSGGIGQLGNGGGVDLGHVFNAGKHLYNSAALSEKNEDALGQSVGVALTNQYGLNADARLQHYVMLVGLTVASASPSPAGNWVFGVLESTEVNAFSGPNGYVFITRGAIAQMHDEAELAGVLAHEISHVCRHDGLKQIQAAERAGAAKELVASSSDAQQFAQFADNGVDAITKSGYSQPQEFDADKNGVEVMKAAGYDPVSYLRYLQRLQSQGAAAGAGKIMSTHPGIGERVSRVSKQLQGTAPGGATLAERFAANVPLHR